MQSGENLLNKNLKILLINRDSYKIYYNEIYPSFKTKKKFILINNKVAPLIKTKLSGKIELLKPFEFNLHKSTPFFITQSTKLYIKTGNFIKQDEILGIIIYEQIVTGDIVQGLPKIEEILEARKTKSSALLTEGHKRNLVASKKLFNKKWNGFDTSFMNL